MFEQFTTSARGVVTGAREQARQLGHAHVGTEHLLLALLEPAAGVACDVLRDAGVDASRVRRDVQRRTGPEKRSITAEDAAALRTIGIDLPAVLAHIEQLLGPEALTAPPTSSQRRGRLRRREPAGAFGPRVTPRFKEVLELSLREALALRHVCIGAEHILLGLLRDGGGLAARVLADSGVDLHQLRSATLIALRPAA
jgi:ATP-dependent Clp protease ATP-binding subunit ClpA